MWKWGILILAVAGAAVGIRLSLKTVEPVAVPPPVHEPVRKPYARAIAGAGLVEPASENVVIGVSEPGLLMKVCVKKGDKVKAGDPLFEIDSRALKSQLVAAQAAVASADAELERVKAYQRKENEAPLRAKAAEATAGVAEAQGAIAQAEAAVVEQEWSQKDNEAKMVRLEATVKGGASSEEELERVQYAVKLAVAKVKTAREAVHVAQVRHDVAKAALAEAQAELNIFLAGAWEPDVKKAKAALGEAQAKVEQLKLDIERRTVYAPMDGTVLRQNLHQGEYAVAGGVEPESAPMVLGDFSVKHVRVDVDEFDIKRFKPGSKAEAFLKGDNTRPIALEFVRVEPFVIPKRSLTNSQRELVDVRVLQAIYRIANSQAEVYVGQQLDVFIEASAGE